MKPGNTTLLILEILVQRDTDGLKRSLGEEESNHNTHSNHQERWI